MRLGTETITILLGAVALMASGCTSEMNSVKGGISPDDCQFDCISLSSNDGRNQPPAIDCQLSGDVHSKSISTFRSGDTWGGSLGVDEDISINCSSSSDSSSFGLFYKSDYRPGDELNISAANGWTSFNRNDVPSPSYNRAGNYELAIAAVDSAGATSVAATAVDVVCSNPQTPSFTGISVARVDPYNLFRYTVEGASGGSNFFYEFDFNGDGSFDGINPAAGDNTVMTSSNTVDRENIFVGRRNISARVTNECNISTVGTYEVDFGTAIPPMGERHFTEAELTPSGDSDEQAGPIVATDDLASPVSSRRDMVRCDYTNLTGARDGARFSLEAKQWYFGEDDSSNVFNKGIRFTIAGINDPGTEGQFSPSGEFTESITYSTSAGIDGTPGPDYSQSNCSGDIVIVRTVSVTPCQDGTSAEAVTLTFEGSYDCPNLTSGSSSVGLGDGSFYCEIARSDSCVGGGGGGGGQPPRGL